MSAIELERRYLFGARFFVCLYSDSLQRHLFVAALSISWLRMPWNPLGQFKFEAQMAYLSLREERRRGKIWA